MRNGLVRGDLLVDRQTGQIVRVAWLAAHEFVVEDIGDDRKSRRKVFHTLRWRESHLRIRVKISANGSTA